MLSKPITLINPLYQILIEEQLDDFSVLELRDRFIAISEYQLDKGKARRLVYRNILRLVKKQLLKKVSKKDSSKAVYQKTALFTEKIWKAINETNNTEQCESLSHTNRFIFPQNELKERLEQCESDFLACLHELETYQELTSEYPLLKDSLYDIKRQTKVQTSKLIGEIRAIKMALTLS
ncbi:hypothetical protein VFES401_00730 [Aliivibrio fischeri]|uniref:hypothetical protein n=1 Tax=Aliivibrio fischeri TaxID=668 RepID=UPI00107EC45C|nr:hypothetical protein [Aliivibrio fischeri]TGA73270.1 hypothetical protein VFES401_00730 [Aliivibrio fischeri]